MAVKQQSSVIVLAGTGLAINAVYQLRHDRDPFPTVFMGSVWLMLLVLIASANAELGVTIAAVYLLGVVLTRGVETFDFLSELSGGVGSDKDKTRRSRQKKKVKND